MSKNRGLNHQERRDKEKQERIAQGNKAEVKEITSTDSITINTSVLSEKDILVKISSMEEELKFLTKNFQHEIEDLKATLQIEQRNTRDWQKSIGDDTKITRNKIERLSVPDEKVPKELSIIAKLKILLEKVQVVFDASKRCSKREDINNLKDEIQKAYGEIENVLNRKMKTINNLKEDINIVKDKAMDLPDIAANVEDIKGDTGKINAIVKNVESCNGKLKQLDAIHKVLTDKNLEMKQNFPAITQDEQALAQMAEYGRTIMQQLEIAARWYARVKPDLDGIENERMHHATELKEKVNEAKEQGIKEGRKQIIKELLSKYDEENLEGLFEAEADGALQRVKILATFLRNEGIAEELAKNTVIDISEANIEKYRNRIAHVHSGKIRITAPAYVLDGEIIAKAVSEDVIEENSAAGDIKQEVKAEQEQVVVDSQTEEKSQIEQKQTENEQTMEQNPQSEKIE